MNIPYEDCDDEDRRIKELCKLGEEELEKLADSLERAELEKLSTLN